MHADEAYVATPRTCHGCAALDRAQVKAEVEKLDRAGLHFELNRIRPVTADAAFLAAEIGEVSGG